MGWNGGWNGLAYFQTVLLIGIDPLFKILMIQSELASWILSFFKLWNGVESVESHSHPFLPSCLTHGTHHLTAMLDGKKARIS